MAGRPFWVWFKYTIEEFRNMKVRMDDNVNIQSVLYINFPMIY